MVRYVGTCVCVGVECRGVDMGVHAPHAFGDTTETTLDIGGVMAGTGSEKPSKVKHGVFWSLLTISRGSEVLLQSSGIRIYRAGKVSRTENLL